MLRRSDETDGSVAPRWRILIGVTALVAAVGALAGLWPEEEVDLRTMAGNSTVASRDGTAIAFSKWGHGPSRILAYDRRGRAESGNTTPYALEREVEDLGALVEAAGGSAFVFGMSSGAGIVLRATESGMGIKKLALYEPPYVTGGANSSPELRSAVKTVADAVPGSQRRMLEGQSHNVSMKVLAPALVEFFLAE